MTVAREADLPFATVASFTAVAYVAGGVLTIALSVLYRQPIVILWSIAGATLLPSALGTMSYAEAMGACVVAALALVALGLTGAIDRLTAFVPLPVALGMLVGVFVPFGTGMVESVVAVPAIAAPMVAAFFLASAVPGLARRVPPVFLALLVGVAAIAVSGGLGGDPLPPVRLAVPVAAWPVFDLDAILSLAPAMLLTVVGVHNAQSFGLLKARGIHPPVGTITAVTGVSSVLNAVLGAVPAVVGTIQTAMYAALSPPDSRWAASVVYGATIIALGLLAPTLAGLALVLPEAFTTTLAGLALLGVLVDAFARAFAGPYRLAALTAFLVAISGIDPLGLTPAFWALVAGLAVAHAVERPAVRDR
jgi:benzoate membrane transport protein